MADSGHLTPPPTSDTNKTKMWTETRKRLDRFLPHLFNEIFPDSESLAKDSTKSNEKDDDGSAEKPPPPSTKGGEYTEETQERSPPSPSPADVD